jgi:uncharacterized protein (TIGR03086 family)
MPSPTRPKTSGDLRVLVHALDQAGDVLDHVHDDRLDAPTPCAEWDVATLADHLVVTPERFLTMLGGGQPDWSVPAPHVTHGWGPEFRVHADDLVHAWHELEADPPVPIGMQIAELAVHTWDLVTALGRSTDDLDPEVAQTGLAFLQANLKPEMRGQAFGPPGTAEPGAGPYEELAAFAGRSV